jgi:3-phenylpropionate/cinnamic acid dioxygenase small subunit
MGSGTFESWHAITTLMYRYAECIDRADFDGIGELFSHARIVTEGIDGDGLVGGKAIADFYRRTNRVHADGTLRTRHLTTNVIVDIDEDAGTATARSSFLVLQATADLPFQPIVGGRYTDRFERVDGEWRFTERQMGIDQIGDVHEHLTFDITKFASGR